MAADTHRPPLPAATEDPSAMDTTDQATDISRRTDHTSYSIPEDGRPITITTHKPDVAGLGVASHSRDRSQASLLIEYFEAGRSGDKKKPSVRVKVTPSSARKGKAGHDAVQITGIGKDKKPSYTRRISLGSKTELGDKIIIDGTELSRSTASDGSGRPPVEVEVLDRNSSDVSQVSRDLRYLEHTSDVSSMPPDSSLGATVGDAVKETMLQEERVTSTLPDGDSAPGNETVPITHLQTPSHDRTRSISRERITQKVLEKLTGRQAEQSLRSSHEVEYEPETKPHHDRRRRSSRVRGLQDVASPGSSQLSSNVTRSQGSYRSGASKESITNNPRLLAMVEDTVKRLLLPEIQNLRSEQRNDRNLRQFEHRRKSTRSDQESYTSEQERSVSKASSTPDIRTKHERTYDEYGERVGHGHDQGSERTYSRRSSRSSANDRERHRPRSSRTKVIEEDKVKSSHRARDAAAAALGGGILTAAALKHLDSKETRRDSLSGRDTGSYGESTERGFAPNDAKPYGGTDESVTVSDATPRVVDHERSRRVAGTDESSENAIHESYSPCHRIPFTGGPTDSDLTRDSIASARTDQAGEGAVFRSHDPSGAIAHAPSPGSIHVRTPMTVRNVGGRDASSVGSLEADSFRHERETPIRSKSPLFAASTPGQVVHSQHHVRSEDAVHHVVDGSRSDLGRFEDNEPLIPSAVGGASHITGKASYRSGSRQSDRSGRMSPLLPQAEIPVVSSNRGYDSIPNEPTLAVHGIQHASDLTTDEAWLQQEHLINEQHRRSLAREPAHQDACQDTHPEETESLSRSANSLAITGSPVREHEVDRKQYLSAYHEPHHLVAGIESAVGSLVDPSTVTSSFRSSAGGHGSADRSVETLHANEQSRDSRIDVQDYSKTKPHEELVHETRDITPVQRPAEPVISEGVSLNSKHSSHSSTPINFTASGIPDINDPMPEIGHGLYDHAEPGSPISVHKTRAYSRSSQDSLNHYGQSDAKTGYETRRSVSASSMPSLGQSIEERTKSKGSLRGDHLADLGADERQESTSAASSPLQEHAMEDHSSPKSSLRRLGHRVQDHAHDRRSASLGSLTAQQYAKEHGSVASRKSSHHDFAYGTAAGAAIATAVGASALTSSKRSQSSISRAHLQSDEDNVADQQGLAQDGARDHQRVGARLEPESTGMDEGYVSGIYPRSPGVHGVDKETEAQDATLRQDTRRHAAQVEHIDHVSSHGPGAHKAESPLYDSATGRGMNRIESKDVVALMDHLTVRDGQRSARDTEILVTLVRNATDIRQEFDDLRRFITVEDRMIMKNTDKNADATTRKILNAQSSRGQTRLSTSQASSPSFEQESVAGKRKNIFKRALKGLGAGKSSQDNAKIEAMLLQLLDDVNALKEAQGYNDRPLSAGIQPSIESSQGPDMSSYEALRAEIDPEYNSNIPMGTRHPAGRSSSVQFSPPTKQTFHSGYDGRRDSIHRVSTVMEGDEEDEYERQREEQLTPRPYHAAGHRSPASLHDVDEPYDRNATPTKANFVDESLESTPHRHQKNVSTGSAGVPKVSRWSKTTASSAPEGYDSRRQSHEHRPLSTASLSQQSLPQEHDDVEYVEYEDSPRASPRQGEPSYGTATHRSRQSFLSGTHSSRSRHESSSEEALYMHNTRHSQSPELHFDDQADDFEDPRYSAVRNSLLLQHPQPRPGPTQRHQSNLESQAEDFGPSAGSITGSDVSQRSVESEFDPSQWGSNPALSLSRAQKLGRINADAYDNSSTQSPAGLSPASVNSRDKTTPAQPEPLRAHPVDRNQARGQPTQSRTYDRLYYNSPLGSGHLLEPIEEVRYSLETDSGRVMAELERERERAGSPDADVKPVVARGGKASPIRKITGPRPMVEKASPGKVARKPVGSGSKL